MDEELVHFHRILDIRGTGVDVAVNAELDVAPSSDGDVRRLVAVGQS